MSHQPQDIRRLMDRVVSVAKKTAAEGFVNGEAPGLVVVSQRLEKATREVQALALDTKLNEKERRNLHKRITTLLEPISLLKEGPITTGQAQEVEAQLRKILTWVEAFTIDPPMPWVVRLDQMQGELRVAQAKMESLEGKLSAENLNALVNLREQAEANLKEVARIVESARRAAGEVALSKYQGIFSEAAADHARDARRWLGWTIALAGATVALAFGLLALHVGPAFGLWDPLPETTLFVTEFTLTKVLALAILIGATYFASYNYRVHRHNVIINQHRQNALNSFEAFYEKARTGETKDAVLKEATRAIYAPQETGYGELGVTPTPAPLLNVIQEGVTRQR